MAEKFLEPQNPLKKIDETTGEIAYIYPLTTDKQVIMENGERLNTILNENILYVGDPIDNTTEVINADSVGGYTPETLINSFINKIYPVGSTYITSTNQNPESYLGGTWSLTEKGFITKYGTSSADGVLFSMNTTNTTSYTCYYLRHGQTIRIRIGIKTAVALSDTAVDMGQLNFNALGITGLGFTQQCCSSCDGGNVVVLNQIAYDTGAIQVLDIIGADTVAAGNTFFVDVILQPRMDTMLNSACDKFYWKRTA